MFRTGFAIGGSDSTPARIVGCSGALEAAQRIVRNVGAADSFGMAVLCRWTGKPRVERCFGEGSLVMAC